MIRPQGQKEKVYAEKSWQEDVKELAEKRVAEEHKNIFLWQEAHPGEELNPVKVHTWVKEQEELKKDAFEVYLEKLGGRAWEKGDMKRIYLSADLLMKKMDLEGMSNNKKNSLRISLDKVFYDCVSKTFKYSDDEAIEAIENIKKSFKGKDV